MKSPRQGFIHWLFLAIYLAIYKVAIAPHVTPVRRWIVIGVGLAIFLAWLARDTLRTKRDLRVHLEQLDERKRANRRAKEEARLAGRADSVRADADG